MKTLNSESMVNNLLNKSKSLNSIFFNPKEITYLTEKTPKHDLSYNKQLLFENSPISLWELDWTDPFIMIDSITANNGINYYEYFKHNIDFVKEVLNKIKILDVNEESLKIFNAEKKEQLLQSLDLIFYNQKSLNNFSEILNAVCEKKEFYETEMEAVTVDGEIINIYLRLIIPKKNENTVNTIMSILDITDKLKLQAERDAFFNVSLGLLCIAGTDGYFKRLNPAWVDTLGWSKKELKARPFIEFVHPDDVNATMQELEKLKNGVATINFINRYRHKNGSYKWLNWLASPVGDVLYTSATDITEQKQSETKLNELLDKLNTSNKELEQFAYVASHDLQEPLRMVASFTQLIEKKYKDKLDDAGRQYIYFASNGALRMQKLINDLLSFSRITTKGSEFKIISLTELLEDAIGNLRLKIEENSVEINYPIMPVIMGDKNQIIRLFQNLIDNSIKYRSINKPIINISFIKLENNQIRITFEDNGIGFDNKYKEKIFVIFERLHNEDKYSGTGIGLAICKKIVERHRGEIWVESIEGMGTKFYFTLNMGEA